MTPSVRRLGVAMALGLSAPAAFGQGAEWKTMEHADLTPPGPVSWAAKEIWADVVDKENAYLRDTLKRTLPAGGASLRLAHASFESGGATYFVSIALTLDCEAGGNHNALQPEPSLCPLRIARKAENGWKTIISDRGCYVDPQDSFAPASHKMDGTQALFDAPAQKVITRANVGGQWVGLCSRTFNLPR